MRILQTPVRFTATGGVERYVQHLSRALVARGHEVVVIAAAVGGEVPDVPGVTVRLLPHVGCIANTQITPGLPLALLREEFDLVHTHIPTPWSADWSMVIAHLRGLPLVVTFHNEIVGRGPTHLVARAYNLTLERLVLSEAGRVLVARDAYLPPTLTAAHRRISFIPPGTDTHCFVPMVREPLCDIAFLSVLDDFHHYKGVEVLFKAVKILSMSRPVSLTIGGDGPLRTHYEEMAKEYGIRSHVHFSGFIPDSDLPAFYSSARVFVLPSTDATREGFGIVLLEAMACSRPVIATTIAGMAAQIRAYGAGCIVPVGDASALAVAIASVLDDEEAGALMGAAGRRLVCDEFSWESVAAKVEAVYQEIC